MASEQAILDRFVADVARALPAADVLLYGSAARGRFDARWSDLNVLVIVDTLGPPELRALTASFAHFREGGHQAPLVMTREEWATAADAFPIELADMQAGYRVLRGRDVLAGLTVARADLRRALENEWRGKLLRLRQGYIAHAGDPVVLGALVAQSARSLLVLARATVLLAEGTAPPGDGAAVLGRLASHLGRASGADPLGGFGPALAYRAAPRRGACPAAEFEPYLAAVARASEFVDHLTSGESPS